MAPLYKRNWSRQEILKRVGHMNQVAGIKLLEAADGLERGSRVFQVWTGSGLCFNVLADRALDISACQYKGVPLAWISAVGDVHPAYYEPEGFGWFRSFQGGLLATCGLDHFGPPCIEEGSELHKEAGLREEFGLHGRVGNLPASLVGYRTYWQEDDYNLEITGEVRQTRVFGENIVLRRRISTQLGSNRIQIEDVVTNEGFALQRHMILYHLNTGFPLVSEESRLRLEVEETVPRDEDAKGGLADWMNFSAPTAGYRQQVFRHVPDADAEGKVRVKVENPRLGLGLRWTYNKSSLPYLLQWKMMGEGTYVLGIEPSNCGGRAGPWKNDNQPHLAPDESCHYVIDVEVIEIQAEATPN